MPGECSSLFDRKVHGASEIIIRIMENVLSVIDRADLRDIICIQPEVEDIGVLTDPVRMCGFVDADHIGIELPAQADLIDALAVFIGNGLQYGTGLRQAGKLTVHQRTVTFELDIAVCAEAVQAIALIMGMALYLVDHRVNAEFLMEPEDMLREEVGNADSAQFSGLHEFKQRLKSLDIFVFMRLRPMNEIEIEIIEPQSVERVLEFGISALVAVSAGEF